MSKQQIQNIIDEVLRHKGWTAWFNELEPFRQQFSKYQKELANKVFFEEHQEDHHARGYFAPLDLKNIGFSNKLYTPAEQLTHLAGQFAKRNIRFIYVALPCKAAVYTSMYVDRAVIPDDKIVIPQWRKVLLEAMLNGVEVVDMLPIFLNHVDSERPLYSEGHTIAPYAAELIASETAKYLDNFKANIDIRREEYRIKYKFDWFIKQKEWLINGVYLNDNHKSPYRSQKAINAEIAVFGNCNIAEYIQWQEDKTYKYSADFTSQLAYELKNDVLYIGRHLPFSCNSLYDMATIPPHAFYNKKCAIYVGFPSASFVRISGDEKTWSIQQIPEIAFAIPKKE